MIPLDFTDYKQLEHLRGSLERYFQNRIEPGSFLTAVLSNDLVGSYARADSQNIRLIGDIVSFLYNRAPAGAWGSPERVTAWLKGQ